MTIIRAIVWGGLLALVAAAAIMYPQLPTTIPQHIGPTGEAGNFVPRSPVHWGLPVLLAVVSVALTEGVRAWLPRRPELFNFPGKEQLLLLPPEYRGSVIARMQRLMDVVNVQLVLTFVLMQWMLWRGAHGQRSEALTISMLVLSPALLVVVGLMVSGVQNEVDRAQREYDSRRNPLRP